uniref:GOLD domain-containing protein n=1 Tax=Candidozyma auris TaxID=498019 RepID=A0A0L0P322_CANAR
MYATSTTQQERTFYIHKAPLKKTPIACTVIFSDDYEIMKINFMLASGFLKLFFIFTYVNCQVHFYVDAGNRQCFTKDLSVDSVLLGSYKIEIQDDTGRFVTPRDKANTGVIVDVEEVFSSNNRVVHHRGSVSGKFSFSPLELGNHRICITPKLFYRKKWRDDDAEALQESKFKRARISLDLGVGDSSNVFPKPTKDIEALTSRILLLIEKVTDIKREQSFIRAKEASFRDLLERACERVVTWLIVQVSIFGIALLYQLWTLLRFYMKRKVHVD